MPLSLEVPQPRTAIDTELAPLDLRPGVMERPGRKGTLVDGEALDRRLLEDLAEAGDRVAVVEVVEVALSLSRDARDIEAGFLAGSGEGDVAPLLEAEASRAENEGESGRWGSNPRPSAWETRPRPHG